MSAPSIRTSKKIINSTKIGKSEESHADIIEKPVFEVMKNLLGRVNYGCLRKPGYLSNEQLN
jgi:hypothetical protein